MTSDQFFHNGRTVERGIVHGRGTSGSSAGELQSHGHTEADRQEHAHTVSGKVSLRVQTNYWYVLMSIYDSRRENLGLGHGTPPRLHQELPDDITRCGQ